MVGKRDFAVRSDAFLGIETLKSIYFNQGIYLHWYRGISIAGGLLVSLREETEEEEEEEAAAAVVKEDEEEEEEEQGGKRRNDDYGEHSRSTTVTILANKPVGRSRGIEAPC